MKSAGGAIGAMLVFGLIAGAVLPASAQVSDASPEAMKAALEARGYTVTVTPPADGNGPMLNTHDDTIDANFDVAYDACAADGTNCAMITFQAGFTFTDADDQATLAEINEWNLSYFSKAVIDEADVIWLALEVNRVGGLADANLQDTLTRWEHAMIDFVDFIGWRAD